MSSQTNNNPISISSLRKYKKENKKFTCLTSYDATFTSVMNQCGVDVILVGDSLGMVIQGHDSTLPVTMDDLIYHLQSVSRSNTTSHIMADMPFMSYATDDLGLENAKKLMQNGAHSIKIEGGEWISNMAQILSDRGIPVCAHMGLTPQAINRIGGYFVQGRNTHEHEKFLNEALELEKAGAAMLLLECVPTSLSELITNELKIPVIGIGAGNATDGQIMVIHDLLGISCLENPPKFVKDFLSETDSIEAAIKKYIHDVKSGVFPAEEHSFS